jgi:murein tripeptide amidase MpaA
MKLNRTIMKKRHLLLIALLLSTAALIPDAQGDIWDPFHTKEQKITMWKNLWNTHANTIYTSIGKTYNGNAIWLFTAGNLTGRKILWDGELHGNEDKGSELLFLIAQWLLESNTTRANQILETTYVMFIPVVNDMDIRGNGNNETSPYGVDLNRNFATGWTPSNPNSDLYSGDTATSEPETKALRNVFSTYRPVFYVNMHCGAGPYAAQYQGGNLKLGNQVIERAKTIAAEMEITP